ncbi:hypothetical protein QE361_003686 [Sphingomonas sp. SORGH_AS802]|nr:hypothetical protein [Sphingomonas sp. SORGH_AS_0438]MDR6136678.1 hypothetical protein [Sphingomonas sp. SORGH_AS_0802]
MGADIPSAARSISLRRDGADDGQSTPAVPQSRALDRAGSEVAKGGHDHYASRMMNDQPMISQFLRDWEHHRSGCLPLGWALRERGDTPWVRFHALPGSKRYAENPVERRTILTRANGLGDRLLGPGQLCWIIEAHADDKPGSGELAPIEAEPDDPGEPVWRFYVRRDRWQAGAFDDKLLSIAADEAGRAVWMRCDNGAIFAPYDGGFDLFPPTIRIVNELKAEHSEWLSEHPTGL